MPSERARCFGCCSCVAVVVLLHQHVLCAINLSLCTNFLLGWLAMATDGRPDPWLAPATVTASAEVACGNGTAARDGGSGKGTPRWIVLLASQRSGSTWINRELGRHRPAISFGGEALLDMARACRSSPLMAARRASQCDWPAVRTRLEDALGRLARGPTGDGTPATVVGVRVMYDHLLPHHRRPFAEWAACRRVSVVHIVRRAVIESYW
jgi:hypothetical protein